MVKRCSNQVGLSLIELMVALAVFALLMTLAVPSYQKYVKQSRRDDAKHLLLMNAQRLQRCFTLEGVYNGACVTRPDSKGGYYRLTENITTNTFTLTATPVANSSQEGDGDCQSFTLDQTGWKTATGDDSDNCW